MVGGLFWGAWAVFFGSFWDVWAGWDVDFCGVWVVLVASFFFFFSGVWGFEWANYFGLFGCVFFFFLRLCATERKKATTSKLLHVLISFAEINPPNPSKNPKNPKKPKNPRQLLLLSLFPRHGDGRALHAIGAQLGAALWLGQRGTRGFGKTFSPGFSCFLCFFPVFFFFFNFFSGFRSTFPLTKGFLTVPGIFDPQPD